jgi:hypothetical protein
VWNPAGIATLGFDHSDTSAVFGNSRSSQVRTSRHKRAVSTPPGSFFTSEPAMPTRNPDAPAYSQNFMMRISSRRTACGPGASTPCCQGCSGSGTANPHFNTG